MTNVIDSKECGNVYIEIAQDKGGSYKVTASENGKIFDKKTYGEVSKAKARFRSLCRKYCTDKEDLDECKEMSAMAKRLTIREEFEDEYRDSQGYLTEDHAEYVESVIYIPVSVFTKKTNYIVEYIIEEAIRSDNVLNIGINNYKMSERQDSLVELDEDEEIYNDIEDITLYVRFIVDENGEYDFNEYGIEQSVSNIKRYVLRQIGY